MSEKFSEELDLVNILNKIRMVDNLLKNRITHDDKLFLRCSHDKVIVQEELESPDEDAPDPDEEEEEAYKSHESDLTISDCDSCKDTSIYTVAVIKSGAFKK